MTPPHKLNPDIPTELSSFVMKAVRRDKQLRFADAGQMLAEFRAMQNRSRRVRVKPIIIPVSPTVGGGPADAADEEPRKVVVKRHMTMPETNRSGFALFRDKKPTSAFYIILFMILLVSAFCEVSGMRTRRLK